MTDDVSLGGVLSIWNAGQSASAGDRFVVLSFDQRLDETTFASVQAHGFAAGIGIAVGYKLHDVTRTMTTAAVPEPAHWALLLAGVAAVGGMAHRSRRRD